MRLLAYFQNANLAIICLTSREEINGPQQENIWANPEQNASKATESGQHMSEGK